MRWVDQLSRAGRAAIRELRGATPAAPLPPPPAARITAQRTGGRALRTHYRAAASTRTLGDWTPILASPDDIARADMRTLRARARELERSNDLIGLFIDQVVANVMGPGGMEHKAQVRDRSGNLDQRVNETIDAAWDDWRQGPVTVDGLMNLEMLERVQLRNVPPDGESFTRRLLSADFRHGLALQSIDPDIIDERRNVRATPGLENEIRMGVEIDSWGRRIRYHLRDDRRYLPGTRERGEYTIDAAEIRHHFLPTRGNETRGTTWFTRAMMMAHHGQEFLEGAVMAARIGANAGGFIRHTDKALELGLFSGDDKGASGGADGQAAAQSGDPSQPGSGGGSGGEDTVEMEPGTFPHLAPGEQMDPWAPNYPNTDTESFDRVVSRHQAAGLGAMHYEVTGDLSATSWSSMRGGELSMTRLWQIRQNWWRWSWYEWIYDIWLEAAVLSGALVLPTMDWRLYRARKFSPQVREKADQLKAVQSDREAYDLRTISRTRICAAKNIDFADVVEELKREKDMLEAAGIVVEPARAAAAAAAASPPADGSEDPPADGGDTGDEPTNGNGNGKGRKARSLTNRLTSAVR